MFFVGAAAARSGPEWSGVAPPGVTASHPDQSGTVMDYDPPCVSSCRSSFTQTSGVPSKESRVFDNTVKNNLHTILNFF